jgi:hypothetical protein
MAAHGNKRKYKDRSVKRFILASVLFLLAFSCFAQLRVNFSMGYGTYQMKQLSSLQESIANEFPIKGKTISYPGYINFEGGIFYDTRINLTAGLTFGYGSSGARTYYGDYSGSIFFDQRANYHTVLASVGYIQKLHKNYRIHWEVHPGVTFTNLEFRSVQKIGYSGSEDDYHFKSKNLTIQPTVTLLKKIGRFGISGFAGVNLNLIKGKLMSKEHKDAWLIDDNNKNVEADWSGIRIGASLNFYFEKKAVKFLK